MRDLMSHEWYLKHLNNCTDPTWTRVLNQISVFKTPNFPHVLFLGVNSFPGSALWFAVGAQNSIEKRRFFGANSDAMFLRPRFKAMPWQRRKEATAAALRQAYGFSAFLFGLERSWKNTKQHKATMLPGMARGSNLRIFCLFFKAAYQHISAFFSISFWKASNVAHLQSHSQGCSRACWEET